MATATATATEYTEYMATEYTEYTEQENVAFARQ